MITTKFKPLKKTAFCLVCKNELLRPEIVYHINRHRSISVICLHCMTALGKEAKELHDTEVVSFVIRRTNHESSR
jgi:hypothetical protein